MRIVECLKNNPVKRLYEEEQLPIKIRRSLTFMVIGNIMGNAHGLICGSGTAAMIGLATELGANDMIFGIMAAIPQVTALLQLPFSVLVNRTHKRKKYMLTLGLFSRALWMLFGLIPYIIPMSSALVQLWTIIFLLGISSSCGAVINVCWFPWLSDLMPIGIRGRFLSIRESILAAANVILGLIVANVLETLPADTRYAIIFLIGGIFGMMDMLCFGFCEEVYSSPPQRQNIFGAIGQVLKNRMFMKFVIMWTAWSFTANLSGVYLNPYSMNEMGLSFTQIMIFANIASAVVGIFVMPKWGSMIDLFGCRNVMAVTCVAASLTPLFYLFSSPGNIWPTLLHNTIGAAFWCGANLTANNMQLSCSASDTRPTYIALFSCVTALAGVAFGSVVGGVLLESWNSSGMFTGAVDRYQVLCIVSVVLRLGFTILLVPGFDEDSDSSLRDFLYYIRKALVHPWKRKDVL